MSKSSDAGKHRAIKLWPRSAKRRTAIVATLALAAAGVMSFGLSGVATAGSPGTWPGGGTYIGGVVIGSEPLVVWNVPGHSGEVATCIQDSNNPPFASYGNPTAVADATYAELNYLYATSGDSNQRLGELSGLNSLHAGDSSTSHGQWAYVHNGSSGLSESDADAMLANAAKYAGPYTVHISGTHSQSSPGHVGTTYAASAYVTAHSGADVPNAVIALTGTDLTLNHASVTTSSTGAAASFTYVNTSGHYTGTIKGTTNEHVDVYKWLSHQSGMQNLVGPGPATPIATSANTYVDPIITADIVKLTAGDATKTPQAATFTVKDTSTGVTLGSFTTLAGAPTPLNGVTPGDTYSFTETKAPAGAYIPANPTFTVVVSAAATSGYTITLTDPATPKPLVVTQANLSSVPIGTGQPLSDVVTVSGDDGEPFTLHSTLYGPVPVAHGVLTCAAVTLSDYQNADVALDATVTHSGSGGDGKGNGAYSVSGPTATDPGCYGWAQTVTLTTSGVAVTSQPTDANESSLLFPPGLVITTHVNIPTSTVGTGVPLHDVVTVNGNDGESGTIDATLYGPVVVPFGSTDCSTVTLAQFQAAPTTPFTAAVDGAVNNGNGNFNIAGPTVTTLGCYGWGESLTVSPSNTTALSGPTARNESTLVSAPPITVTTQVNVASSTVGTGVALNDTVTLTGDDGENGVITASLYGPVAVAPGATDCSSLTSADYLASTKQTITVPIDGTFGDGQGNGAYAVNGPTVTALGCYGWAEHAVLSVSHASATSPAGATNETTLVSSPQLAIVTDANYTDTPVGNVLSDEVTLTGDDGENGVITGTLYGPVTVPDGSTDCSSLALSDYQSATTQTFTTNVDGSLTNGNSNYTVTGAPATSAGCYGWGESVVLTPSAATASSLPTDQLESTFVTAPTVVTTASTQWAQIGDKVHDTLVVSGTGTTPAPVGPVGTVTATTYFMPFPSPTTVCADLTEAQWAAYITGNPSGTPQSAQVASQDFLVTTDGTLTTDDYTVPGDGCVTFGETWALTGSLTPPVVESPPGSTDEVVSVTSPVVTTFMGDKILSSSASFTDKVTVTGLHGEAAQVFDNLVGPVKSTSTNSCIGVHFDASKIAGAFAPIFVTTDGVYTTSSITVKLLSDNVCYTGQESLKAGARIVAVNSPGALAETRFIPASAGGGGGGHFNTGLGANAGHGPDDLLIWGGIVSIIAALAIGMLVAFRRQSFGRN